MSGDWVGNLGLPGNRNSGNFNDVRELDPRGNVNGVDCLDCEGATAQEAGAAQIEFRSNIIALCGAALSGACMGAVFAGYLSLGFAALGGAFFGLWLGWSARGLQ